MEIDIFMLALLDKQKGYGTREQSYTMRSLGFCAIGLGTLVLSGRHGEIPDVRLTADVDDVHQVFIARVFIGAQHNRLAFKTFAKAGQPCLEHIECEELLVDADLSVFGDVDNDFTRQTFRNFASLCGWQGDINFIFPLRIHGGCYEEEEQQKNDIHH